MRRWFAKFFIPSCPSLSVPMVVRLTPPFPKLWNRRWGPTVTQRLTALGSTSTESTLAPIIVAENNGAPPVGPAVAVAHVAPAHTAYGPGWRGPAPAQTISTEQMSPSEHEFIAFCQRVNPLGDMRRVVVAAEAAHRYLNITSVDPDGLAHLFTLAGWPIPHSFVQTLRNAARTKFRWLERISGLSGHYKVTNTGRSIVLGESEVKSEPE